MLALFSGKEQCALLETDIHLCTLCRRGRHFPVYVSSQTLIEWHWMLLCTFDTNNTTFNNGSLGSRIDEERSELRYCNVNCRIQWIIESLNAHCTLWYSGGYACLSVIDLSQHRQVSHIHLFCCLGCWRPLLVLCRQLLLNVLAEMSQNWLQFDKTDFFYLVTAAREKDYVSASNCPRDWGLSCLKGIDFWYLTSNQVGLPAELKHINKRRKRN